MIGTTNNNNNNIANDKFSSCVGIENALYIFYNTDRVCKSLRTGTTNANKHEYLYTCDYDFMFAK